MREIWLEQLDRGLYPKKDPKRYSLKVIGAGTCHEPPRAATSSCHSVLFIRIYSYDRLLPDIHRKELSFILIHFRGILFDKKWSAIPGNSARCPHLPGQMSHSRGK
jgi:hypothetical protein